MKCKCGCSQEVKEGNRYINHHGTRKRHWFWSIESKIKRAITNQLPEVKLKRSKAIINVHNRPEIKKRKSEAISGDKNPSKRSEVRVKISKSCKGRIPWNIGNGDYIKGKLNPRWGKSPPKTSGYGKGQFYESPLQGKIWLRSSYELVYAKYLDDNKILWYYEIQTFDLGDTTYTPDFFLPKFEKFIEIKGYMLPKAKIKIDKFLEQYPFNLEILYREDLIKLGAISK